MDKVLSPAALMLAGTLTGNELGTLAVIHPALARVPAPGYLLAEQSVTHRYGKVMPVLMTATTGALGAAAAASAGRTRWLFTAAAGCYTAMLALTLLGNVPLNSATLRLTAQTPEAEFNDIRRRWNRLHLIRVSLDVSGLILAAVAATRNPG